MSLLQVMGLLPRFQAARKQAVEDAQEHPTDAPLVSNPTPARDVVQVQWRP